MKVLLILIIGALTCGCVASYTWTVQESNRPDGVYGDWVTEEQIDDFGSYSFSTAKGQSSDSDFGAAKPKIVIQDDFVIKMFVGDGYICSANRIIRGDAIWFYGNDASRRESLYLSLPEDGNSDHFDWRGRGGELQRLMYQLAIYDKLVLRFTDTCGKQRTVTFAISGEHHNYTNEIAPD